MDPMEGMQGLQMLVHTDSVSGQVEPQVSNTVMLAGSDLLLQFH